jgi:hypothetical protein
VRLGSSHWIVLTPGVGPQTGPSTVTFSLLLLPTAAAVAAAAKDWTACDLTTGQEHAVTHTAVDTGRTTGTAVGTLVVGPLKLTRTTVLHVAPAAEAAGCAKPSASLWLPLPGYNYA